MTYYILEPEDEWAHGYTYVNADTDAEAIEIATDQRPTVNYKIIGKIEDLKDMVDEGYPPVHDTVYEE